MIPLPKLKIGTAVILLILSLLIGANYLFGAYASSVRETLFVYLFLIGLPLWFYRVKVPLMFQDVVGSRGVMYFVLFFFVFLTGFYYIVKMVPQLGGMLASFEPASGIAIGGLLLGFTKAFSEELAFRKILPLTTGWNDVWLSLLFGLFHFFVLAVTGVTGTTLWLSLIWLSLMGYVWAKIARKYSILASTGAHFGYNLVALGIAGSVLPFAVGA